MMPGRPLGVVLIALFLLLDAGLIVVELLGYLPAAFGRLPELGIADVAPGLLAVTAGLKLIAAIGLWRGSRSSWVLTMFLVGLSLIADFYLHFAEEPRYPRLALDVLTAFYLNQGVVRDFFERRASGPPERMRMP